MDSEGKGYKRLTIEQVRKVEGFENKTEEEIQAIILTLEKLSVLIIQKFAVSKPPT